MLLEYGHEVALVRPAGGVIEGIEAKRSLSEIEGDFDTLTVYVGPRNIVPTIQEIVAAAPKRVILNPGTESPELKAALDGAGIRWLEACTLVLLRTGQFDKA